MTDRPRSITRPRSRHGERGQFLPLIALFSVALLGIMAVVVDVAYWRYQQRLEQSAADSAAVAGAIRLFYPTTSGANAPVEVTSTAQDAATANGLQDGIGGTTVEVNSPPVHSAKYVGNARAVEVVVSKSQQVFFASIFGQKSQNVDARAVAVQKGVPGACVYQLDPKGSLYMVNLGTADAVKCGVNVNGAIPAGSVTASSLAYSGVAPAALLNPPLVAQKAVPFTDPCYSIPGCAYLQKTATPPGPGLDANGLARITPGVYHNCCFGSTLDPGIYYIYGGFNGAFAGDGVTIVNADGSNITLNGGGSGTMNITAPTTGPTAGVAYYQSAQFTNTYTANGNPGYWGGMFHAPGMLYRSNGKQDTFSFLVIGNTYIDGAKPLTVDPSLASPAIQALDQPYLAVLAE